MPSRDVVEKFTADFVALGASCYGTTSWPVRLFNPIIAAEERKIEVLWDKDASGESILKYFPKATGNLVYRRFEFDNDVIRCLADHSNARRWKDVQVHINMGSLGVRKSYPTTVDGIGKLLGRYGLPLPSVKSVDSSEWYNLLRGLPLEEMGMSTNLDRDSVPAVEGHKMCALDLEAFLEEHPFSEDEPLVADWDYGPDDLADRCIGGVGVAREVCVKYGGPPARDRFHVDLKLNPLWILVHKPWPRLGSPDGNWYKDTLDKQLKGTLPHWKRLE